MRTPQNILLLCIIIVLMVFFWSFIEELPITGLTYQQPESSVPIENQGSQELLIAHNKDAQLFATEIIPNSSSLLFPENLETVQSGTFGVCKVNQ